MGLGLNYRHNDAVLLGQSRIGVMTTIRTTESTKGRRDFRSYSLSKYRGMWRFGGGWLVGWLVGSEMIPLVANIVIKSVG